MGVIRRHRAVSDLSNIDQGGADRPGPPRGQCPRWVKTGNAQPEQMFSA